MRAEARSWRVTGVDCVNVMSWPPSAGTVSWWLFLASTALVAAALARCMRGPWLSQRAEPEPSDRDNYMASLERDRHVHRCRCDSALRLSLCGYDPASTALRSLARFEPIKRGTQCVFARRAILWGSRDCDTHEHAHENVQRSLQAFLLFASLQEGVDGFLFEVPGARTLPELCAGVRAVLGTLSSHDPSGRCCMAKTWAFKRGWVFSFNGAEFFVTTFAPCYGAGSSRFAFGECDSSFVLLQPYHSFLLHNVGSDTPTTNWERPQTTRDRIRVGFRNAGRPYPIPADPTIYPVAHNFVYPLDSMGGEVVRWWDAESCDAEAPEPAAGTLPTSGLEHLYDSSNDHT